MHVTCTYRDKVLNNSRANLYATHPDDMNLALTKDPALKKL